MRLYLVQHGDALPQVVDPQRPLSEQGQADVERIASLLKNADVRVSRVIHSGKMRAQQTAELLAASVAPGEHVEAVPGLDPMDPPELLARKAIGWTEDHMVVGHLPYMEKLVSLLLTGREAPSLVGFSPGSVVCLERRDAGEWAVVWMVRPDLLAGY